MVVFNYVSYGKVGFKYFIRYKYGIEIKSLYIKPSKMSGYTKILMKLSMHEIFWLKIKNW